MLTKIMQPICEKSFRSWLLTNGKFNKLYYEMGEPVPFDVTLRDGIQSLPREHQDTFTLLEKINLYHSKPTNQI